MQQNKLQKEYLETLNEHQQTIKKMNHDISNHIRTFQILCSQGNTDDFTKYANELISAYSPEQISYCDNQIVNALILSKVNLARKNGIDISVAVSVPQEIGLESFDLVSLFSNLLDNAIDACAEAENLKKMSLSCITSCNKMVIKSENTFNPQKIKFNGNKPITSKADKLSHGLGMKIISDIAKKYGGSYVTEIKADYFLSTVMLSDLNTVKPA